MAYAGPIEYIIPSLELAVPGIDFTWKSISRYEDFFEQKGESIDALIVEAEVGTAWTLLHPEYTVVIPANTKLNIPLGFAVAKGQYDFAAFLGRWINAKKSTGEIKIAYDYWILGQGAEKKTRRWSVKKDVLGWGQD